MPSDVRLQCPTVSTLGDRRQSCVQIVIAVSCRVCRSGFLHAIFLFLAERADKRGYLPRLLTRQWWPNRRLFQWLRTLSLRGASFAEWMGSFGFSRVPPLAPSGRGYG